MRVTQLVFGPYSPFPVAYRITVPDPDTLRGIATDVERVMNGSPMMRTVNADWGTRARRCTSRCSRTACRQSG